jgi:hypothetical protein
MINRSVPDKTHARQPTSPHTSLCSSRARARLRRASHVSHEKWHQEKTCEDITPYGVITQFPKNGRLFTPKYRLITPSTFDHTEKNLFTPSIYKITPS